jgi:hypothetical protein
MFQNVPSLSLASNENPLQIPVSDLCGRLQCVPEVAKETEHKERSVDRKNIVMMVGGGEV